MHTWFQRLHLWKPSEQSKSKFFISWAGEKGFLEECALVSTGTELIFSLVAGKMQCLIQYKNQNKNIKNEECKEGERKPSIYLPFNFFSRLPSFHLHTLTVVLKTKVNLNQKPQRSPSIAQLVAWQQVLSFVWYIIFSPFWKQRFHIILSKLRKVF